MNVDLIVSIYLDRGSTPLGSIILQRKTLPIHENKKSFSLFILEFQQQKKPTYVDLRMTRTGLEPVLPPWKGGVLTAWPTGQDNIKAGDENRTRDNSLEGCSFTTKLHPHFIKSGPDGNRTRDLLRDRQAC